MSIITDIDKKDSVFANAADAVSDFETIFDEEDAIIEFVCGFGENGESLIGRDPEEENTTDNSDGKVDMEDSSPSTDFDLEPDAETGKGLSESDDLDAMVAADEEAALYNLDEAEEEQTDETNKKDVLEEPVETDIDDFHDESADLYNLDEEGLGVCPDCGKAPCTCGRLKPSKLSNGAEEQTDETDAKNILDDVDDAETKDFHDESADIYNLDESDEQTDETNKKDILEEPVETEVDDFHDESADIYNLDEAEEQTDETNKKDVLEEPVETDIDDFHDESADIYNLDEAVEGEDEFDEFDDSLEGMEDDEDLEDSLLAEADDLVDDTEEENIEEVEDTEADAMDLEYEPGEDDLIIDDVIDGKEI